jgi:hypothetical protein
MPWEEIEPVHFRRFVWREPRKAGCLGFVILGVLCILLVRTCATTDGPEQAPVGSSSLGPQVKSSNPKQTDPVPDPRKTGVLRFKIGSPVLTGVEAWVEIDGERVAQWREGARELQVTYAAGTHQLSVHSVYAGVPRTFFKGTVTIPAGETREIFLGQ